MADTAHIAALAPPRWVSGLDGALRLWGRSDDPVQLFERIAHDAARSVGGSGAVDPDVRAGLTLVLADTLADARTTRLGLLTTVSEIRRRITIATAVRRIEAEVPDAAAVALPAPVFVVGLARTGTTALQQALAARPGMRTPRYWELVATPSTGRRHLGAAAAVARTAAFAAFAHLAMPALRQLHPLGATAPEETTQATAHSPHHAVRVPLPSYRAWLAHHDPGPDLVRLRLLLQTLRWTGAAGGRPAPRWVLKSPFHLHDLAAVLEVFPGSTVVWTHRDPAVALASWCELVEAVQAVTLRRRDPAEIGPEWLASWADAAAAASAARAAHPDRFIDVDQAALAADPDGVTAAVMARVAPDAPDLRRDGSPRNPDRPGPGSGQPRPRRAPLARYGLDIDEVRRRLAVADGPAAGT